MPRMQKPKVTQAKPAVDLFITALSRSNAGHTSSNCSDFEYSVITLETRSRPALQQREFSTKLGLTAEQYDKLTSQAKRLEEANAPRTAPQEPRAAGVQCASHSVVLIVSCTISLCNG